MNKVKKELNESFNPIKDLIYCIMRYKLWKLYKTLEAKNIMVHGIKTDCLLVQLDYNVIRNVVKLNTEIGGFKFQKDTFIPEKILKFKQNEIMNFELPPVNIIHMKVEYDSNEINEICHTYNNVTAMSGIPGSGKTTAIKNSGYELLFITPYNKLCQELRKEHDSVTLNRLLNTNIEGKTNKRGEEFDISPYEAICFDEIRLYSPYLLNRIYLYMEENKKLKFFSTGDSDQLPPFGFSYNNVKNIDEYLSNCINIMFPNQVILEENKRLKTKEDKQKLKDLKREIFDPNLKVMDVLKKYFKTISNYKDINTLNSISYFNFRSIRVNNLIHHKIIKPEDHIKINKIEYYKGLELICKKHYKTKHCRLYVNYSYIIKSIDSKKFTITEPVDNIEMTFDIDKLTHFKLPYCSTCHSCQGLTKSEEMIIFDCNTPYVSRKYIWTAITRSTELKNITIFEHPADEIEALTIARQNQYFKFKINNYIRQDKEAKREIDMTKYININWMYEQTIKYKQCSLCNVDYYMVLDKNNEIFCNMSVDRIDNNISHYKDNCRLLCVECNRSKR